MPRRKKLTELPHDQPHDRTRCEDCRDRHDFEPPGHLLDQLSRNNVVIFAGAGVSTEARQVFPWTFYDHVHAELKLSEKEKPPFPKLMTLYSSQPDGRRKLLERLQERFSYVAAFPELYRTATRFHRELSTLFYIDTYVTTNWDDYFEKECGAIPFVTPEDFGLWNVHGRKVFKIHGSIGNYGSLVVTEEDYRKARRKLERGALGSALKLMLATKTIIYVGYSFSDHDFMSIQQYLSRELHKVAPTAYIISVDHESEAKFRTLGLTPIFTDATHFISVLKKHVSNDGHFLPDERFDGVALALARSRVEHERLFNRYRASDKPEIVYTASYQDGLKHSFERMLEMVKSGQYSHRCNVVKKVHHYEKIKADNLRRKRYLDVAYVEGYMNGLCFLLADDRERKQLPFYFIYGLSDHPRSLAQYRSALSRQKVQHKAALGMAKKLVAERLGPDDELHHTPFINWSVSL